jgi:hypothetical protein
MNDGTKDVFLCHNKADKDWVRQLGIRIEAETIDGNVTSRRLSVFFDEWDIDYGENFVNRMNVGLKAARYLVVVMSPEFFESGWTNFEWTDVVAEDPWGVKKKLILILLRDVSKDGSRRIAFPAPFKALRYLDFREERRFEQEFQKVLRRVRGLPPSRGEGTVPRQGAGSIPLIVEEDTESWQPDRVREVILGNMLQVVSFPTTVWSAATEKQSPAQVRAHSPLAEGHIVRVKRIWTFADLTLESCQLRAVLDVPSIQNASSRDWIVDPERSNWWMDLLNQSLTTHLSKLAMKRDDKGRFFFRPNRDGTDRIWKNKNDRSRTVAAKKTNAFDGIAFWVHHAARIRFRLLGDRYFLVIEPTYLFTSDGEHPLGGQQMGRMVMMWGGRQKNPDILRNFVFWAKAIAKSQRQIKIETGGDPIVVSGIPASSLVNVGIPADHVRIGSLMRSVDSELDEVAKDVDIVPRDEIEDESDDNQEE